MDNGNRTGEKFNQLMINYNFCENVYTKENVCYDLEILHMLLLAFHVGYVYKIWS